MMNADEMNKIIQNLRLVLSDCDGVLTDGGLYYLADGTEMRKFQVLDGVGFIRLKQLGIKTGIITGDVTDIVDHRARKLKVDYFYKGSLNKLDIIREIAGKEKITLQQVAYIADDIFDVEALKAVGLGCVPSSANEQIRQYADYVTVKGGGEGCFRELAERIIEVREGNESSSICNN